MTPIELIVDIPFSLILIVGLGNLLYLLKIRTRSHRFAYTPQTPDAILAPPGPKRAVAAASTCLRLFKDGKDWGNVARTDVRNWLKSGELTLDDRYFDIATAQWLTLDCRPDLAELLS